MASGDLPRRQHRNDTIKRRQNQSALDILMQMGFPKQRAEKAIAATGDKGVQLASDWLLSHVNDTTLDNNIPREYILYLCPVGPLQQQLVEFWDKSLSACGWNGAHSYFPHITLCPFFKCDDNKVEILSKAMEVLEERLSQCPGRLHLDFFSQVNFIGLFVKDRYYDFLMKVTDEFAAEIKRNGIHFEPHRKQLHLTLAYQYPTEHHETLLKLSKDIDFSADVRWDFRLYSRDSSNGQTEVRKVIKHYTHQLGDELELIMGDFITMESTEISKDGWYHGTSWLTGNSGMFPGTYAKRTQETAAWTMHRSYPLVEGPSTSLTNGYGHDIHNVPHDENNYALIVKSRPQGSPQVTRAHRPPPQVPQPQQTPPQLPPPLLPSPRVPPPQLPPKKVAPCKLFVMRHGERPDFVIGRGWFDEAFNDEGVYTRKNLNLPEKTYKRKTHLEYIYDPPLTEIGKVQAKMTGDYLLKTDSNITQVYTSPSLRCIQTAVEVYKALRLTNSIKIEPGLYEWTLHCGVPKFMDPQELTDLGFPILTNYCPKYMREDLDREETVDDLYQRCNRSTRDILKSHEKDGENVLLVGHSGTLDLCTRSLLGKKDKTHQQYQDFISKIPFCCVFCIQQMPEKKKWVVCKDHYIPMSVGKCNGLKEDSLLQVMA